MFKKTKLIALFVLALSISFFTLNFIGSNSSVNAQEAQPSQTKECPSTKSGKPSCDSAAGCASKSCCKKSHGCYHNIGCAHAHGCGAHCHKKGGYGHGGGHSAADMMGLVHRAKKGLLKEKIKAKLEEKMGPKLDKVADLLVDAMLEEYKAGRASKERRSELEKKMIEIFSGKDTQ